jgi:DNA invertase Pin-like site-specific DNA recombinase
VAKELIFTEKASGARHQRPGLDTCLDQLQAGDILLVWRLDRLGRSMRHLVTLIDQLRDQNIGFRSVCDGAIDTTTPSGELIFHVFSALAQFERRLIQERTNAGLAAARIRGRKGGRPPIRPNDRRIVLATKLSRKSLSVKSGRRGSNPRHPAWECSVLDANSLEFRTCEFHIFHCFHPLARILDTILDIVAGYDGELH